MNELQTASRLLASMGFLIVGTTPSTITVTWPSARPVSSPTEMWAMQRKQWSSLPEPA